MATTEQPEIEGEPFALTDEASRLVTRECRFRSSNRTDQQQRTYDPANERHVLHTIQCGGDRYHRFQRVRESVQNPLADDEVTLWTICGFPVADETNELQVLLKDAGTWSREKCVPVRKLGTDKYEPLTLTDGQPHWWY